MVVWLCKRMEKRKSLSWMLQIFCWTTIQAWVVFNRWRWWWNQRLGMILIMWIDQIVAAGSNSSNGLFHVLLNFWKWQPRILKMHWFFQFEAVRCLIIDELVHNTRTMINEQSWGNDVLLFMMFGLSVDFRNISWRRCCCWLIRIRWSENWRRWICRLLIYLNDYSATLFLLPYFQSHYLTASLFW